MIKKSKTCMETKMKKLSTPAKKKKYPNPKQRVAIGLNVCGLSKYEDGGFIKSGYVSNEHNLMKEILEKAQIPHSRDISHKNSSHYWRINGESYRVSNHTKPKSMDVFEFYQLGVNDFRNYNDFYNVLKEKFDLSDKSNNEEKFKEYAKSFIYKNEEGYFVQPDGSEWISLEGALNNMWITKKKLPDSIETKDKYEQGGIIEKNNWGLNNLIYWWK